MPEEVIKTFEIKHLQVMDEEGNVDESLMPDIDEKLIKEMYKWMVFSRVLDNKLFSMQRQGRVGTVAQVKGQEACQIASALALEKGDWIAPSFREHAAIIARGAPMEAPILYSAGDERGSKADPDKNILPPCIPVGSHAPYAMGIAWGNKLQKKKEVVVAYFGDGATSTGDVMEAMNFSGVFKAPVIFCCQNNQWAISVPREKQTAAETFAQKAIAFGIHQLQVDGNDVFAVYKATKEAADRARKGEGPTFLELFTYRLGDHTTSDDAKKYRDPKEVEPWEKKDPILRLKKYMEKQNMWSEDDENKLQEEAKNEVEEAVKRAESIEKPKFEDMYSYMYETLTPELEEELKELTQ